MCTLGHQARHPTRRTFPDLNSPAFEVFLRSGRASWRCGWCNWLGWCGDHSRSTSAGHVRRTKEAARGAPGMRGRGAGWPRCTGQVPLGLPLRLVLLTGPRRHLAAAHRARQSGSAPTWCCRTGHLSLPTGAQVEHSFASVSPAAGPLQACSARVTMHIPWSWIMRRRVVDRDLAQHRAARDAVLIHCSWVAGPL